MPPLLTASLLAILAATVVQAQIAPGPDTCPPGSRYCVLAGSGKCLRDEFWCDGVAACDLGADEAGCSACWGSAFMCDGVCKRGAHRCDGFPKCRDGADEAGCGAMVAMLRNNHKLISCLDGSTRRQSARCDGVLDCPDHGDELVGCAPELCQGGAFWCDGGCRHPSHLCDGYARCSNGLDEMDCPSGGLVAR